MGAGTNTAGIPAANPQLAFVSNGDTTVSVYVENAPTGQLLPNGYSVVGTPSGDATGQVVIHPTGQFVYVPHQNDNNVWAYALSSHGTLMPIPGSPFPAGANPAAACMDPSGQFLYVANALGSTVSGYSINPSTGVLTPIGVPTSTGVHPSALSIDPSGVFLYVANASSNSVSAFAITPSTGVLTPIPGSPFATGVAPIGMTIDPKGRVLFVANLGSHDVTAFAINAASGALFGPATFTAGGNPTDVTTDLSGEFVYVSNFGTDNVSVFSINQVNGIVTEVAGSPFPAEVGPVDVQLDPGGELLHVVNNGSNSVSIFSINPSTGVLTLKDVTRTRTEPVAIAISAGATPVSIKPAFLYALTDLTHTERIVGYLVDESTGTLSAIPGSPYSLGTEGSGLAMHPNGQFVYVAKPGLLSGQNSIAAFEVNPVSGALSSVAGSPFPAGTNPYVIAIEPSGRFLYGLSSALNLSAFSIDPSTGALDQIAGSPFNIPTLTVNTISVDPTGRFLYVGSHSEIVVYHIDGSTGGLTQVGSGTGFTSPQRIVFDASGRFGYTTTVGGIGTVTSFLVDAISGVPRRTFPFSGDVPGTLWQTIDPLGNFFYVPGEGTGTAPFPLLAYRINRFTSQLTAVPFSPMLLSAPPMASLIDPSGRFLYLVHYGSSTSAGSIDLYHVSAQTGALTAMGSAASNVDTANMVMSRVLR
jgi:6-phosphogluconolactonase (cycloisomerase 2 family)